MKRKFRVGDWVEVRSKEEILRTLDSKGQIDGMPFMPEMFQFCGKRFQIYKRAHKTCDYVTPYPYRTRWLEDSIHLQTRCDGAGHDGCQAGCLIIWKEAWLKPVAAGSKSGVLTQIELAPGASAEPAKGCTEADLLANTKEPATADGPTKYVCQATQTPHATKYLHWWDVRQYFQDYFSGNVTIGRMLRAFIYANYYDLSQAGIGLGPAMRWVYNKLSPLWGGPTWPRTPGYLPENSPTPAVSLNLQPGEWVRVKSHEEILKTVTYDSRNRGMYWDAELAPYCGGTYQVLRRVNKLIDEKSSRMVEMKTACIVLDAVVCQARYSPYRMLCPKEMYPYWREIWLERVETPKGKESQAGKQETESDLVPAGTR
jgi:hypothetical protein